jgi:hypothetical protein
MGECLWGGTNRPQAVEHEKMPGQKTFAPHFCLCPEKAREAARLQEEESLWHERVWGPIVLHARLG